MIGFFFFLVFIPACSCLSQATPKARFDSIFSYSDYYFKDKTYELTGSLKKMNYEMGEAMGDFEYTYTAEGPSVNYEYMAFYSFGKAELRPDTILYYSEYLTNESQFQNHVDSWVEQTKVPKREISFLNVRGYEIPLTKYRFAPTFYYGMKNKHFVCGIFQILVKPTHSADLNDAGNQTIKLVRTGNIFEVPVNLNGVLTLNFIMDTGASDVSVPSDVFSTLIRTGTIKVDDIVGVNDYVLADGSSVRAKTFVLKNMQIGGVTIENVKASVSESPNAPLLLGQSVLSRLGKFTIDTENELLIFQN